jgi:hypothetical protein
MLGAKGHANIHCYDKCLGLNEITSAILNFATREGARRKGFTGACLRVVIGQHLTHTVQFAMPIPDDPSPQLKFVLEWIKDYENGDVSAFLQKFTKVGEGGSKGGWPC